MSIVRLFCKPIFIIWPGRQDLAEKQTSGLSRKQPAAADLLAIYGFDVAEESPAFQRVVSAGPYCCVWGGVVSSSDGDFGCQPASGMPYICRPHANANAMTSWDEYAILGGGDGARLKRLGPRRDVCKACAGVKRPIGFVHPLAIYPPTAGVGFSYQAFEMGCATCLARAAEYPLPAEEARSRPGDPEAMAAV